MILLRTFLVVWTVALAFAGTEAFAQQLAPAPEASTGTPRRASARPGNTWSRRQTPLPRRRGARCSGPAAARSMPRSRCSSCSTSSSRRAPASAAAPSWCIGATPAGARCRRSTAARRPPPRRSPTGSSAGTASRCRSWRRWSAAARSAFPAPLKLLETAHQAGASLPWPRLFEPAIRLADEGFAISPRLGGLLAQEKALKNDPVARAYFYQEDGSPKPVGSILKNPDFAGTLRCSPPSGADAFYKAGSPRTSSRPSKVTRPIPARSPLRSPGLLGSRSRRSAAIIASSRSAAWARRAPGAIAIQQISRCSRPATSPRMKPGPEAVHWFAEAGRLAFADRALYLGDPFFHQRAGQGPRRSGLSQEPRRARQPRQVDGQGAGRRSAFPEDRAAPAGGRHRARHEPYLVIDAQGTPSP